MILVINTGSSSIKMALIDMPSERLLAEGMAERLGEPEAALTWKISGETQRLELASANHLSAMQQMLEMLFCRIDKAGITAVGHRVVHGGERFVAPVLLDTVVIAEIEAISHLAPLHNPANLLGIRAAISSLPVIPHIAVFDTAFHHAMPLHASLYAVPYSWYSEYGVRRYGFHGTSHHYVGLEAASILEREFADCRLLTAHLGNGCSATAIAGGVSVDTTMGLTPLEGLVMGTRSGDVDPGLHAFVAGQSGKSLQEITDVLNRQSGLLGLSGRSNDMRILLQAAETGDERASLAVDIFCYRLAKSLAGLAVALGHVDAIVFTGGIGEHASEIRRRTVSQLAVLGVMLDTERNAQDGRLSRGFISKSDAAIPVLVIAANEEIMIARYVGEVLNREDNIT
ncbi:MAG: acetate kinase [Zetaproteobacteria bacterium CG12_big_fil_rev_8_21_14_0_65_55_1124]|nr:MAG: acetate kinase [Zetaproteobacteria bacterium CG1_02_55_237]PIS19129.1 MAG: acetate kinase [Zetaproteobacteria bacterium CG08_land_8_20_14_0_20_55_17]PIW43825.1 MAG: acetate kinase [Zetaproteobacteria bacterium CG12_big_fil_rev_8_21_14_0_65_55_1124]PIY52971.1 MAG: acetate kinase [Zetaproteobacteria bacterium CG_4_10_14_0_8_um_filter_55_43]PIZ37604.1 MAG: acetate kinase [Zetaproteobacteria bacterium CG_4_10_14_0_2_um_filter_55_20]PJB79655.1 MAG: acetate kinase [Zetaproteobacteria bacteri